MKTLSEQLVWLDDEIKTIREQLALCEQVKGLLGEKWRLNYGTRLEHLDAIRQTIDERIQDRAYQADYEAERKAVLAEEDHEHD